MNKLQTLLALVTMGLALCFSCPSALASTLEISSASRVVVAGHRGHLTVVLREPAGVCQFAARARAATVRAWTRFTIAPSRTHIEWSWRVSASARSATWHLYARCGTAYASHVLKVRGRRGGVLVFASFTRAAEFGPAITIASRGPGFVRAHAKARGWWGVHAHTILTDFTSGPSSGQCTAYAASRRPDIVARVDQWAYTTYLLNGANGSLIVDWDARYWALDAANGGLPTGNTPQPGAVIVFQPGAYGAFASGHVAVVSRVGADDSFTVSEMHAPIAGQLSWRHFSAHEAHAMASDPRIEFIYR
ncbi:MAG: CHAP domain-containing protein [Solirubrobacteraceae bacterium]